MMYAYGQNLLATVSRAPSLHKAGNARALLQPLELGMIDLDLLLNLLQEGERRLGEKLGGFGLCELGVAVFGHTGERLQSRL